MDDAVSKGATVTTGGTRNKEHPNGLFFLPTVRATCASLCVRLVFDVDCRGCSEISSKIGVAMGLFHDGILHRSASRGMFAPLIGPQIPVRIFIGGFQQGFIRDRWVLNAHILFTPTLPQYSLRASNSRLSCVHGTVFVFPAMSGSGILPSVREERFFMFFLLSGWLACGVVSRSFSTLNAALPYSSANFEEVHSITKQLPHDTDSRKSVCRTTWSLWTALSEKGSSTTCAIRTILQCGMQTTLGMPFFLYQVLAGVTADMKIAQEEVFGPVMTIIKVPGNSDEACIKMINSCK